ncbi:MAG: type I-U CRISPR-associated protein Csb2, partial [Rhodospirillaceae bacterium]|nr:type I-U CRISPR-associated protein Csb2 [Rhodospirillaceae bacterium]
RLAPAPDQGTRRQSLSSEPYLEFSRVWASITPIVLDRHLKRKYEAEKRELVANACEHAGLPRPDTDRIQVGKHSAIDGMPPARPLAGEPPWTQWKVPKSLSSRPLVHAVIEFEQDVRGPVLLGAGRFTGLGLCRGLTG